MDRSRYGEWEAGGKKTMGDRVRERIREMIERRRARALDDAIISQLDQIVAG